MLHRHRTHAEAVARITWLVGERALGVVTGEVGAGKTVAARAAVAALDPTRHTVIYLPNPMIGERGLYTHIVRHLGGVPRFHKASLVLQASDLLAAEEAERARTASASSRAPWPPSTSASGCATTSTAWTWPRPPATSSTTCSSPAAPTRCSPTTPSRCSTRPRAASPARSTTSPSRP